MIPTGEQKGCVYLYKQSYFFRIEKTTDTTPWPHVFHWPVPETAATAHQAPCVWKKQDRPLVPALLPKRPRQRGRGKGRQMTNGQMTDRSVR